MQNVPMNPLVTNQIYQDENQPQFSSSNAFSIFVDEQKQPGFNKSDVDVVLQSSLSETAKAISRPPLADVLPDNLLSGRFIMTLLNHLALVVCILEV